MAPVKTIDKTQPRQKTRARRSPEIRSVIERTKTLAELRMDWKHPIHLVHAVTSSCNADCGFCAWKSTECAPDELTTEEILKLYADAREAGFPYLIIWGGEPLMRPDIGEIFRGAKELGFSTSLVTNGYLLPRKLDQVAPYLNRLNMSLDHATEKHDEIRGMPGLYQRIIDATKAAKKKYPKVPIIYTYTLHRDNCDQKSIKQMAVLSHEIGAAVIFNPLRVEAAAGGQDDQNLMAYNATDKQLAEAYSLISRLKSTGYPIINSFTYIDTLKAGRAPVYRCHWPKINLPIEANGDVVDCMNWGKKTIGNIRNTEFSEILQSERLKELAGSAGESCHKCISHHRMEMSEIYEGNPEPLMSWARALSPQMIRLPGKR